MLNGEVIFTFAYSVFYVFPNLLPVLRRQVGEGLYSLSAYYTALQFSLIPVLFLKTFAFLALIYWQVCAERGWILFLQMALFLSLAAFVSSLYGLFISSLCESERLSTDCAAPFDIVFMILGGSYSNVKVVPLLKYLSPFYYLNEALMHLFWIEVTDIGRLCSFPELYSIFLAFWMEFLQNVW